MSIVHKFFKAVVSAHVEVCVYVCFEDYSQHHVSAT